MFPEDRRKETEERRKEERKEKESKEKERHEKKGKEKKKKERKRKGKKRHEKKRKKKKEKDSPLHRASGPGLLELTEPPFPPYWRLENIGYCLDIASNIEFASLGYCLDIARILVLCCNIRHRQYLKGVFTIWKPLLSTVGGGYCRQNQYPSNIQAIS